MSHQFYRCLTKTWIVCLIALLCFSTGYAEEIFIKIHPDDYNSSSLYIRNQLTPIKQQDDNMLARCETDMLDMLIEKGISFEHIEAYDHHIYERLSPVANAGIPLGIIVERGNQGSGQLSAWHQRVAYAGDILAYAETNVDGQLPGFTFKNLNTDSTWHHYIDTDLNQDEALYISASENKIYYAFHYWGATNSAMRYYWYDTATGDSGSVNDFGYGFEGFGVSDKWMVRVGSKGGGWNNQIFAHNVETGERFEMLADSTASAGGYNYDSFGAPKVDGNTIVFTYKHFSTSTKDLVAYSLGIDGIYGTDDDLSMGMHINGYYGHNGSYRIRGRYIVWRQGTPGDIMGYDMGEDELLMTADDVGNISICADAAIQDNPQISDGIIVWEDWRNVATPDANGVRDIYGYDIVNDTEFRSTASTDSLLLWDIRYGEVVLNKHDWDAPSSDGDIFMMNIFGRIQSDYYQIKINDLGEPTAQSLLTGTSDISYLYLNNVVTAAKGPLCALFIVGPVSGQYRLLSYSAITGVWAFYDLPHSKAFNLIIQGENGLILDSYGMYSRRAGIFNGQTGEYTPETTINRPTGFDVGKNIAFIWGDESKAGWLRYYDAKRNTWDVKYQNTTNDPWHVIASYISDSLAVIISGQGDTVCNHINMEVYDLETGQWQSKSLFGSTNITLNRHTYDNDVHIKINSHFAAVSADRHENYYDFVHIFGAGDSEWATKRLPYVPVLDEPLMGENFLLQGGSSGNTWYGYIYNDHTGSWVPDPIESCYGITDLFFSGDIMLAWWDAGIQYSQLWAYSPVAETIQELRLGNGEDLISVAAGRKAGYVITQRYNYSKSYIYTFNGIRGEWSDTKEVINYQAANATIDASGYTGIFLARDNYRNGVDGYTAYGYSALKDSWDEISFFSNAVLATQTSDFCGFLAYNHYYYTSKRIIYAYNAVDEAWSEDILFMYHTKMKEVKLNDRIMMIIEDGIDLDNYTKAHMFSPILNRWNTISFDGCYELQGAGTTPTAAYAWNDDEFKIIFSTDLEWDTKPGELTELHINDYAIAATIFHAGIYTTHYFYPPQIEVIDIFEFTEEPSVNSPNSWYADITWKTNKNSDTRLAWGLDGYYEIFHQDTLKMTKDHRVHIDGLDAQTTYYYAVASVIPGIDTVKTDTLTFNTGVDDAPPVLTKSPEVYRVHDHEASIWWETNEPSNVIVQWGLTSTYTDSVEHGDMDPIHVFRMYELLKDTVYHYRVGGYDRYGNGPFYSGDYTFRTENKLKVPQNLTALDSTIWGCSYMTWDPPRLDSILTRESFNAGMPVDWKIYNRGNDPRGNSWMTGYVGDNAVAYCNYGKAGEYQEEWLITNPVKITTYSGGVLNFWHYGLYNNYDNAPNRVMMSMTGTAPGDFTTIWSSRDLPNDWQLAQIDIDWYNNYGETVYFAFVYASTNGETWVIDDIYMDFDIDGFYENFNYDNNFWTQWQSKSPNGASRFGLQDLGGNFAAGVEGFTTLPDGMEEMDYWIVSPFIKITESHHLLGFWQIGGYSEYDNAPNEVLLFGNDYAYDVSSTVIKTIYPVPEYWTWTTIDLSQYIWQTRKIAFRYHSWAGPWWNGDEWTAWFGENWYIDDMYIYENAPLSMPNPDDRLGDKAYKTASSPDGKRIPITDFTMVTGSEMQTAITGLESEIPGDVLRVPEEKPALGIQLNPVTTPKAPSVFAETLPRLEGYAVYGRFSNESHFNYRGYVTSSTFIDWDTYLGYEREYYVEAVYDKGHSQPSNYTVIKGGTGLLENEHAYDTGIFGYAYWWYCGNSFANNFWFPDSLLKAKKMKAHVEIPGTFRMRLSSYDNEGYLVPEFTSDYITPAYRGWVEIDVPDIIEPATEFLVEFLPRDTIAQLSYDPINSGISWLYDGSSWGESNVTFFIRLIGDITGPVSISDAHIPRVFELKQNYPNPFNPTTTISYSLPEAVNTVVRIYDLRGALVRTLVDEHHEAGYYKIIWDGKDARGQQVASGLYLIHIQAGDFKDSRKMVLVR